MTSKQSSWCCCFSGRPPEITRLAADPIQPIQIDIPMPDDENEIDTKFSEIVVKFMWFLSKIFISFITKYCITSV